MKSRGPCASAMPPPGSCSWMCTAKSRMRLHHARAGILAPSAAGWAVQCALTSHVEKIWARAG